MVEGGKNGPQSRVGRLDRDMGDSMIVTTVIDVDFCLLYTPRTLSLGTR